jgi:hypothetical protein
VAGKDLKSIGSRAFAHFALDPVKSRTSRMQLSDVRSTPDCNKKRKRRKQNIRQGNEQLEDAQHLNQLAGSLGMADGM